MAKLLPLYPQILDTDNSRRLMAEYSSQQKQKSKRRTFSGKWVQVYVNPKSCRSSRRGVFYKKVFLELL